MKLEMTRRLFVALVVLLLWSGSSWAQSSPQMLRESDFMEHSLVWRDLYPTIEHVHEMMHAPQQNSCNYTPDQTQFNTISAGMYGQNGGVVGTMTIQANVSGGLPSHKITVTAGTSLTLSWTSANANSAQTTEFLYNTGQTKPYGQIGPYSQSINGSYTWTNDAADVGKTYVWVYAPTGSPTQDRVSVTTVSGTAGTIINQDTLPENFIAQSNVSYGGLDVYQACGICSQFPSGCSGAQHTPNMSLHTHNNNSGEDHVLPLQQAGNIAGQYDNLLGTLTDAMSVLPAYDGSVGDVLSGDSTAEVDCSVMGTGVYSNNNNGNWLSYSGWFALTKVQIVPDTCKYLPGGGVRCDAENFCEPPSNKNTDWTPLFVQTNQFGIADIPSFWLGGTWCATVDGSPAVCAGAIIAGAPVNARPAWWQFVIAPGMPSDGSPFECSYNKGQGGTQIPWPFKP